MDFIADIFLAAGALGAGMYCFILGRRLNRFNDLEKGVGGAVAVLSAQVDDLTKTLSAAQNTASSSAKSLTDLTVRAEAMSQKLELQMASLHDIPVAEHTQAKNGTATVATPPGEPMFIRHRAGEGHQQ